jgi:sugar-specific transcriptional regulator TrmB
MAIYKTDLNWLAEIGNFSDEEQKVLLALSHETYKWRTKERLAQATGLPNARLDSVLSDLIGKGKVRPSFSKKRNLIFGLKERVG